MVTASGRRYDEGQRFVDDASASAFRGTRFGAFVASASRRHHSSDFALRGRTLG
jgi:hypothetical protein